MCTEATNIMFWSCLKHLCFRGSTLISFAFFTTPLYNHTLSDACLPFGKSILRALKVTLIEGLLIRKCKFVFNKVSEGRKLFVCELLVIFPQIIFTKCWIIKIIISNLIFSGNPKQMLHLSNVKLFYHKLIEFTEQNQATNQPLIMLHLVAKTI